MTGPRGVVSRRTFLRDLGHGAVALSVIGLVGCSTSRRREPASFDPLTYVGNRDEIEAFWCVEKGQMGRPVQVGPDPILPGGWSRFGAGSLGYLVARGGEATVVDTGPWCEPDVLEAALLSVGLDWSAVSGVIVTHKHPDHWVGLTSALEHASDAVAYAGAADIPHIASPRPMVAVGAGDRVMDLAIIPTPGHTPGHIAVHDEAAGVLVVGDAVAYGKDQGFVLLPTSEDLPWTRVSLDVLAGLSFDTLLPGHGEAIVGGAEEELTAYLGGP